MNAVVEKTYHTSIENSTFIYQPKDKEGKGVQGQMEVLQFHGTTLRVSNPAHIADLDAIADAPGCPIYTRDLKTATAGANEPFREVKNRAGEIVEQIAKAGQRV
jgi:hypothetical protein